MARVGVIKTPHGEINTPAFVVVGTKATVKALRPEDLSEAGALVVLANTYHLYLQPGEKIVQKLGGLGKFMNWDGPTMTDSGGFQAFSLGAAFGRSGLSKFVGGGTEISADEAEPKLAKITEDGVEFKSHIDGSEHFFTPEKSIQIQHALGADIIFAFDECTSPAESREYQKEAMERTHRWAERSIAEHNRLNRLVSVSASDSRESALFGIVQGGRFFDLREESAKAIRGMDFAGFGIGGSFNKDDLGDVLKAVNKILPEGKPRHLLGIGEPMDLFLGVENGADTFDCVAPTRLARNGSLYTEKGRINILNGKFSGDDSPIDKNCSCHTCRNYTKGYLHHLFKAKEINAGVLSSIHNVHFIVNLVKKIRRSILDGNFGEFKKEFIKSYYRA